LEHLRARRKPTKIPATGPTELNDGNFDRTAAIEALQGNSSRNENAPSAALPLWDSAYAAFKESDKETVEKHEKLLSNAGLGG